MLGDWQSELGGTIFCDTPCEVCEIRVVAPESEGGHGGVNLATLDCFQKRFIVSECR